MPKEDIDGWRAGINNLSQLHQVNLITPRTIQKIETRGRWDIAAWVKQYKIEYSLDGTDWKQYNDG